jgi:hypothetical protein
MLDEETRAAIAAVGRIGAVPTMLRVITRSPGSAWRWSRG